MVSPSTIVPQRNETPRKTARQVDASRRAWPRMFFNVTLSMRAVLSLRSQQLDAVEHALRRGPVHRVDDPAVVEEQGGVGEAGRDRVVRHHDDRLSQIADGPTHEVRDLGTRL